MDLREKKLTLSFLVGLEGRTKSYVSHEAAMKVVESVGLGIAALFQ